MKVEGYDNQQLIKLSKLKLLICIIICLYLVKGIDRGEVYVKHLIISDKSDFTNKMTKKRIKIFLFRKKVLLLHPK